VADSSSRPAAPFKVSRKAAPLLGIALSCLAVAAVWAGQGGWLADMVQRAMAEPLALAAPDGRDAADSPGGGPAANGGEMLRLAAIQPQDGERTASASGLKPERTPASEAPEVRKHGSPPPAGAPERPLGAADLAAASPGPVSPNPRRAGTVARTDTAPLATGSIPVAGEKRPGASPLATEEARAETAAARAVPQARSTAQRRPSEMAAGGAGVATAASAPSPAEGSRAAAGAASDEQPVREARLPRPRPDKAPAWARSAKPRILARAEKPRRNADRRRSATRSATTRKRPRASEAPAVREPPVVVYYYRPYRRYRPIYRSYLPPPVYYRPPPVYYVPPQRY
jgi:hypothetical protein